MSAMRLTAARKQTSPVVRVGSRRFERVPIISAFPRLSHILGGSRHVSNVSKFRTQRAANQKSVEALHGLVGRSFRRFSSFAHRLVLLQGHSSAIRINPGAYAVVGRAARSTAYRRSKSRMTTVRPTFFPIEACRLSLIGNLWTPPPIAMNAVRSG
jgi:hypothetical protein